MMSAASIDAPILFTDSTTITESQVTVTTAADGRQRYWRRTRVKRDRLCLSLEYVTIIDALNERDLLCVLDAVCRRHGVTREEVCGRRRPPNIAQARLELYWHLRNNPSLALSYDEIGQLFHRAHSTILMGLRAFQKARRNGKQSMPQHIAIPPRPAQTCVPKRCERLEQDVAKSRPAGPRSSRIQEATAAKGSLAT